MASSSEPHPPLPVAPPSSDTASLSLPSVIHLPPPSQRVKLPPPSHLYRRLPPHCLLHPPDGSAPVPDYLQLILTARVYEQIKETPLTEAATLSAKLGVSVGLKREDLQPVFSFKIRGAYNLMAHLSEEERWKGVVAVSAGNHAQGVALSSRTLGVAATIVMPVATPSIKYTNVAALGAKVVLHGDDFDSAKVEGRRLVAEHGVIDVPPYDDPYVIAGQGTIAVEMLRQTNVASLDAIFVCVGGGGLLAGVAAYVKRIAPPHVKVIGVEARDQTAMTASLLSGNRELLPEVGLFCDGTAVRIVGEETFRVCNELVDAMVLVNNDEVCAAIKDVFQDTRSVPEPSGALAVAGLKRYVESQGLVGSGKRFLALASGANMNFDRLRFVAERSALGEGKEALLSVIIPEKRGSFLRLHSHIHPRAITEFSYRFSSPERAYIFISFQLSGQAAAPATTHEEARRVEIEGIVEALKTDEDAMEARDISDNEMAKSHARFLIGGRKNVPDERLISFAFPERPGALRKFLVGLMGRDGGGFNCTLFHYRNHGSDMSRVLAGIQVPPAEAQAFDQFLQELGYPFTDETSNEVYRAFLVDPE